MNKRQTDFADDVCVVTIILLMVAYLFWRVFCAIEDDPKDAKGKIRKSFNEFVEDYKKARYKG